MNYFVWAAGAAAAWPQSPGLPHESFKGCCLGWWLVIGQLCKHHVTRVQTRAMSEAFIHITYVSSMGGHSPYKIQFFRRHVNAEQEWPLLCSRPVLLCRVLRGQLRGCRARGQAGEGAGEWDVINANWIYISTFHRSHLTKNQNTVTHKLAS